MEQQTVLEHVTKFLDEYLPLWFDKKTTEPLFIFISGPQGSGKSYTSGQVYTYLQQKYRDDPKRVIYMSIDDFYYTHAEQLEVERKYPDNKLLKGRGMPGTHDVALLSRTVGDILKQCDAGSPTQVVTLPRYDKSKFNGEGDRMSTGLQVELPVDIVILEGWFLGFDPVIMDTGKESSYVEEEELKRQILAGDMKDVNANLFIYSDLLWRNPEVKSLGISLATDNIENVYEWRKQQEHELIAQRGSGMTDKQVEQFVDKYFPSYRLYYNEFIRKEDLGSIATLTIGIDKKRQVFAKKIKSIE